MSEIDDIQKRIEQLLKDTNMNSRMGQMRSLSQDLGLEDIQELLQAARELPEVIRQFKGQLPIKEWVDLLIRDIGPELAPLKELGALFDQYTDSRVHKTAERVIRLVQMGISEEGAIKIVLGVRQDIETSFKKGAEAARKDKRDK